jgi:arginase family enzyme
LHAIGGNIVAADLVEFNPAQDISNMTATVAAKLLKEMLAKMISEGSRQQRGAGVGD